MVPFFAVFIIAVAAGLVGAAQVPSAKAKVDAAVISTEAQVGAAVDKAKSYIPHK